ncbi:MAG TPA: hypothetical protein ENI62_12120 [Gammaproteobacteria bacterium]|nr:hypothetical protein [Gammaproteobacteria bacterium]
MYKNVIGRGLFALLLSLFLTSQSLAAERVQPFILASSGNSEMNRAVIQLQEKLSAAGFQIIGNYAPYKNARVFVFTNDTLKQMATQSVRGGYGAILRAAVTRNGNKTEISYTNPEYWANAYRMQGDYSAIKQKLATALGAEQDFGSGDKILSAADMRNYHYTFMMEYFDDPSDLNEFTTHDQAVTAVEQNLAAKKGGSGEVYKLSLGKDPKGRSMTLFGVALTGSGKEDCSADQYIMSRIDKSSPRHTAHLPYELMVYGNKVEALYARFRIAISWPSLPMMSSNTGATFLSIMCAPGAIEKVLQQVAGKMANSEDDSR